MFLKKGKCKEEEGQMTDTYAWKYVSNLIKVTINNFP